MKSSKITEFAMAALITLTVSICSFAQSASPDCDCRNAAGNLSVVNNGDGTTSGRIRQGGSLNGTTTALFTSAFTPTPDPTTVSFTDDLTLTTRRGVLKTHNVGIFDLANGVFSAINRIDPAASSGDFAGATGVLYINGNTNDGGATFHAKIAGEICFPD